MRMRRNWWATKGHQQFPNLTAAALRLFVSAHTTTCATEHNWNVWGSTHTKFRANLDITTAEKCIFIKGNESTCINGSDEEIMLAYLAG
jgi:hypothetical protein